MSRSMYSSESRTIPLPSVMEWWSLQNSALRSPSSPSIITNTHSGRVRSKGSS